MYDLSKNIGSDKQGKPSLVRLLENDSDFHNVAACLSGKCDCKRVGRFTADEALFTKARQKPRR